MTVARELVTMLRYELNESGLSKYVNDTDTSSRKVRKSVKGIGSAADAAGKQVDSLGQRLRGVLGVLAGALSVKAFIGYVDSWGQMEARMRQATSSAEEYGKADADLARISRLTYKSYSDTAELFVRTRRTMSDLGKSTQDTIDLTEVMSLGMALSSTKAQDQESAIGALSKAVMEGKVTMEGYQTMMRTTPRLQTALADGLGVTTDKLLAMVKAGQITTNVMLPALQSQLARMRVEAEEMPVTVADAFVVLNDAAQRFFGKTLTFGRKAVLGMTTSIEWLADNIEGVAKVVAYLAGAVIGTKLMLAMRVAAAGGGLLLAVLKKFGGPLAFGSLIGLFLRMLAVTTAIHYVFDDIFTWFKGGDSLLGAVLGPMEDWSWLMDGVVTALEIIKNLFGDTASTVEQFAAKWGLFAVIIFGIITTIGLIPAAVIAVVIALGGMFNYLRKNWDAISAQVLAIWAGVVGAVNGAWEGIKNKASEVWSAIGKMIANAVPDWARKGFNAVSNFVSGASGVPGLKAAQVPMRAGAVGGSQVVTNSPVITIHATSSQPAAVADAAQRGVTRGMQGNMLPRIEAGG